MQARKTFIGFDEPIDFATISLMPITSHAARIGPPAIIPVPEGADLSSTLPAPSLEMISWWSVLPSLNGILNKLFLFNIPE